MKMLIHAKQNLSAKVI